MYNQALVQTQRARRTVSRKTAKKAKMFKVKSAENKDIKELIELLQIHMKETLHSEWGGSIATFERDGFGKEFNSVIAEAKGGKLLGFGVWRSSYDVHHCISGGELMDLYVHHKYRGQGVAPAIMAFIAYQIHLKGGQFLRGQAIPNPQVEHLYNRVAVSFPGTIYNIGGRTFRCLGELSGKSPREMISNLPNKSLNYEP